MQVYHVIYRPAGQWRRYTLEAPDQETAVRIAERQVPRGYELDEVAEVDPP